MEGTRMQNLIVRQHRIIASYTKCMRSCYGGIEFEETPEISEPQVSIVLNVGSSSLPTTYNSALQRENKHAAVCPKKVSPSRVHHVLTIFSTEARTRVAVTHLGALQSRVDGIVFPTPATHM